MPIRIGGGGAVVVIDYDHEVERRFYVSDRKQLAATDVFRTVSVFGGATLGDVLDALAAGGLGDVGLTLFPSTRPVHLRPRHPAVEFDSLSDYGLEPYDPGEKLPVPSRLLLVKRLSCESRMSEDDGGDPGAFAWRQTYEWHVQGEGNEPNRICLIRLFSQPEHKTGPNIQAIYDSLPDHFHDPEDLTFRNFVHLELQLDAIVDSRLKSEATAHYDVTIWDVLVAIYAAFSDKPVEVDWPADKRASTESASDWLNDLFDDLDGGEFPSDDEN
jgi:hypothetical protein